MVDVVGLRFVTTGEKEALQALDAYRRGQKSLADLQDKHVAAFNRVIRAQEQAKRAYDQLAGSLDPNVAAANRLASAQKTLQTAFEQGIISAQKKAAMLRQLNAQYRADELNRYAAAQRKVSDTIIQGDAVVKRLSGDMQLLTERLKQGTVTQQQHDTALKALARQLAINNNYVKANGALNTQKAMAELRAMEATRAAAAADAAAAATKARLTQSYNQLLASINPVIARQQQTRQTVDMLRAAVAAGAITTTQAAQALNQYRNALRAMDAANQLATRGMNRVGVITQQTGYQVGDFIVQIQSGTNVMVALGQQATQLIGTFAMLARTTRGIAIFSGLGVVVPILTAIGAAWSRMRAAADESANAVKGLRSEIESLDRAVQDWTNTKKASAAGITVEELLGTRGIEQARADLETATEALAEFQATMNSAAAVGPAAGINFVKGLFDADAASAYENAVRKVIDAHTLLASLQQKQGEEQFANFAERKRELDQQLALQQEIAQFGRDSAQVRQLELEQEIANRQRAIDQQVQAKDLTEAQGVALKKLVEDVLRQEDALRGSVVLSETFKSVMEGISISGLLSQMDTLNSQLGSAIFGAGTMSARLRGLFDAGVAAAERAQIQQDQQTARQEGFRFDSTKTEGGVSKTEAFFTGQVGFSNIPEDIPGIMRPQAPSGRGRGGGGRGTAREQEDYLKNLLLEAQHKQRLVGLTEEQTRRQELLFDLEKRKLPIDEERIEQIIRVEAETRALMALEEQRMQLMQTVEGHIENAFMSFVQGSATVEEAFKGMLRNIILAIYQQQVAEPAARAVGGLLGKVIPALFSANGNVFSGGAHVTAYANGGVVNSPTMFQHSGGLGVMGEAGPEAIMPLKRGANGKLGVQMEGATGGNVTVQQYFQISANGDESVRRIVRQEAPRMAEMAKSAVVDAKRRGGSYGRSF